MTVYDVVVVGGGNLELWTAHRLARRGFGRIAVLERCWAGGGATSRSAGVVRQQGGSETAAKLGRLSRELYLQLGEELGLGEAWAITEPEAGSDIKTTARRDGDGWVLNGEKWFVTGGEVRLNGRG